LVMEDAQQQQICGSKTVVPWIGLDKEAKG
jgi:hypothetical protein